MRAVVDTNVLVSGVLSRGGAPAGVLKAWREARFQLVTSAPLVDELRRVLTRPPIADRLGWSAQECQLFVAALEENAAMVMPGMAIDAVAADQADNRVLEAAVTGAADYIVSGDRHLLELSNYEGIPIVAPARFLAVLALS